MDQKVPGRVIPMDPGTREVQMVHPEQINMVWVEVKVKVSRLTCRGVMPARCLNLLFPGMRPE